MLEEQERDHCGCNEVDKGLRLGNEVREDMETGHEGPVGLLRTLAFTLTGMGCHWRT